MSDVSFTGVNRLTMTWKIKNFSYVWRGINSPPVSSRCFKNTIFYLRGNHRGLQYNKHFTISIATNNKSLSHFDYEVALINSDGSPEKCLKEEEFEFKENNSPYIHDNWIKETLDVSAKSIFEDRRDDFLPNDTLTIRCRLQQRGVECSASEEHLVSSSIGVRRKAFVWTFDKFSSGWTDVYEYLFTIKETYGSLKIKASIVEDWEERFVVEVHRDKGEMMLSTLKISLLDAHGTERKLMREAFFFEKSDGEQVWQLPPLINKSELVAAKSQLLPNDILSLKCEFAASLGLVNGSKIITCPKEFISSSNDFQESPFSRYKENGKPLSGSLPRDLKCILDTGSLSDLTLRLDSDEFPVHKSVLGARSPTFKAMFTNDFKEKSSGQVLISDIDADTMRRFLIYLYTDTMESLTMENATKLYVAADKYEVICMREICATFLKTNLSSSSACPVLILADLYQDKELKTVAQDFISKHDSEILRSQDWRDLEKSNHLLAMETLREICLKKSIK